MSHKGKRTKVLIVDDHNLVRSGFRALLEEMRDETGLEVIGEATDGQSAIKSAREFKPDIVLMDLRLPDMSGIEATRKILSELPGARVIALSVYIEPRFVTEMMSAGACGYLPKDCTTGEFREAIETVTAGGHYLGRSIAPHVADQMSGPEGDAAARGLSDLTNREKELLSLLGAGLTVKEAAAKLNLSIHTVYAHRKNIMAKLGIASSAELMRFLIRSGLTPF
jgi:DNA-binding NarL/FixJ family response regulator